VDENEILHFMIYTVDNLGLRAKNWATEPDTGVITNGVYQIFIPDDGVARKFWVVGQQL